HDGLLELVVEGGEGRERHRLAVLAGELQVLQGLDQDPFAVAGAADDVDEVDRVTHFGDRVAADHAVDGGGNCFRADAELASLVLINVDLDDAGWLVPVVSDVADMGVPADHGSELLRISPDLADVRPADAELHGTADRRSELEALHEGVDPDEVSLEERGDA